MKKKNSISASYWLLLLLVLLCCQPLLGQPLDGQPLEGQPRTGQQAAADTGSTPAAPSWQARSFSAQTLAELEEDRHMDYALAKAEEGAWDRFKSWLAYKLSQLLSGASSSGLLDSLFYIFCIAAGVFIVVRFMDIDLSSLLHHKAAATAIKTPEGITENIHELNFEAELSKALQVQNYALAVRLLYLAALKNLSDGGHIRWEPGKTNRQYQREVKQPELSRHFTRLGYYFEYAWYGNFPLDEALYQQVKQEWELFCRKAEVPA